MKQKMQLLISAMVLLLITAGWTSAQKFIQDKDVEIGELKTVDVGVQEKQARDYSMQATADYSMQATTDYSMPTTMDYGMIGVAQKYMDSQVLIIPGNEPLMVEEMTTATENMQIMALILETKLQENNLLDVTVSPYEDLELQLGTRRK